APRGTVAAQDVPVAASAGCTATPVIPPGQTKVPFTSGTDTAYYFRNVPPAPVAPTPAPMVIDLHGWGEGAELQTKTSNFGTLGDTKGFVTITPQAPNAEGVFDAKLGSTALTYLSAILDDVESTLCIDQNRVFVGGYSQGAIMSSSVACQFADRVAAVATIDGITTPDGCDPARPVPVVAFHGTDDPFVGYTGLVGEKALGLKAPDGSGRTLAEAGVKADTRMGPPVPDVAAAWATRNGCEATPPTETPIPPDVTKLSFSCPAGTEVVLYRVNGGGHAWPGSEFTKSIGSIVGPTTFTINATDLAWQFFADHPKEG
ncbi:MAG TPA: PHB depolymerase family esterase, partial [Acidimicrobiales bacterium]